MSKDQTTEEPDAAKVARPFLKSGGRGDPFADCNLLTLLMWGYPAVALLGTDLRQDLVGDLRTFRRVYLVLDSDDAGIEATCRLQAQIGSTAVGVALPEGVKDVGELAPRQDGQELFAAALLESVGT